MLILRARRDGPPIHIGHDVLIMVTGVHGQWVRLGIVAPPEVEILRDSVYHKTRGERRAPALVATG